MEPYDPISQLAMCCFGRRPRSGGFKTEALRNQYLYSPSMAHIGPGNTTTWPMGQPYGPMPFAVAPSQPQPYILFTQPMIISAGAGTLPGGSSGQQGVALLQQPLGPAQQTISLIGAAQQASPLHKVPSMAASQYAIYANAPISQGNLGTLTQAQVPYADAIYASPMRLSNGLVRNRSTYLGPIAEQQHLESQDQSRQYATRCELQASQSSRPRALNRDIFKRLEVLEKQVDLTRDMDLVERHGLVITRAIEARSLAPHLTDETLRNYQEHFLMSDDYVIRFIEIIKRPGQTLGLYIRLVHFEAQQLGKASRDGVVITKIESNSPVYTSQVLHIGDEILSINLIDIEGMSLDDVVTLMSIPKRLVLALRIPRGRDPQLRATYAPSQHQQQRPSDEDATTTTTRERITGQLEDELEYAQRARVAARQQFQRQEQQASAARSASQLNFSQQIARQEYSHLNSGRGPLMRPAPAHSTGPLEDMALRSTQLDGQQQSQQQQFESPDGSGSSEQVMMRPSDFIAATRSMQQAHGNIRALNDNKQPVQMSPALIQDAGRNHKAFAIEGGHSSGNRNQIMELPMRVPLSFFEQQMAATHSVEERPDNEADRFREFSVDSEIATLEREAMNKERQLDSDQQQVSFNDRIGAGGASLLTQALVTPARRALPTRPDLSSQIMGDEALTNLSISRPPIISNIRLGETSEQSSYFSSSIDAINRELKELRRQRLALGDNDPNISEEIVENPKSSS